MTGTSRARCERCERCGRASCVHIRSDATQTRHFCLACAQQSATPVSSPRDALRKRIVQAAAFIALALLATTWFMAQW